VFELLPKREHLFNNSSRYKRSIESNGHLFFPKKNPEAAGKS
jgi:hypothetical protein